jgi:hypothetical protein
LVGDKFARYRLTRLDSACCRRELRQLLHRTYEGQVLASISLPFDSDRFQQCLRWLQKRKIVFKEVKKLYIENFQLGYYTNKPVFHNMEGIELYTYGTAVRSDSCHQVLKELQFIIEKVPNLKKITLFHHLYNNDQFYVSRSRTEELISLDMSILQKLLPKANQYEEIAFGNDPQYPIKGNHFKNMIQEHFHNLRILKLSGCRQSDNAIIQMVQRLPLLEEFVLSRCHKESYVDLLRIYRQDFEHLEEWKNKFPIFENLKLLDMRAIVGDTVCRDYLACFFIHQSPNLTSLHLTNNFVTFETWKILYSSAPKLRKLHLFIQEEAICNQQGEIYLEKSWKKLIKTDLFRRQIPLQEFTFEGYHLPIINPESLSQMTAYSMIRPFQNNVKHYHLFGWDFSTLIKLTFTGKWDFPTNTIIYIFSLNFLRELHWVNFSYLSLTIHDLTKLSKLSPGSLTTLQLMKNDSTYHDHHSHHLVPATTNSSSITISNPVQMIDDDAFLDFLFHRYPQLNIMYLQYFYIIEKHIYHIFEHLSSLKVCKIRIDKQYQTQPVCSLARFPISYAKNLEYFHIEDGKITDITMQTVSNWIIQCPNLVKAPFLYPFFSDTTMLVFRAMTNHRFIG